MKGLFTCLVLALGVAGLAGCDNLGDTLSDVDAPRPNENSTALADKGVSKTILGYEVEFKSRLYDGVNTTFAYEVTRPGSSSSALSFFFLESPECAGDPAAVHPTQSASYPVENPPFTGISWTATGMQPGSTAIYSATYSGDVPLGSVAVVLKEGDATDSGEVLGACKGIPNSVNISGSVFVDVLENSELDPGSETGIGNVTVDLLGSGGSVVKSTITAEDGSYLFQVAAGTYSLDVPSTTTLPTDFNEHLYDYFDPTGATSTSPVLIDADDSGNDFGFVPILDTIQEDLKSGTIATSAKKASWWAGEFKSAVSGKGKATFDADALLELLGKVESLLLPEIFEFDDVDALAQASHILNRPLQTDQEKLEQELLAAELNYVAGFGSGTPELDLAMFAFAESDWLLNFGEAAAKGTDGNYMRKATLDSTSLMAAYNGSGTGSGSGTLKRGGD